MARTESIKLPIGSLAVDFNLEDTEGQFYSLKNFTGRKGLLIVFTCNHCPYAKAAWPKIIGMYPKYKDQVAFVAINPNDGEKFPDDSFEEMKKKKVEWQIPFPYLRDEAQEVARAYQAQCTPDYYLFKNESGTFKLFHHGLVSESILEKLLQDEPPLEKQSPSLGCSIKWKGSSA